MVEITSTSGVNAAAGYLSERDGEVHLDHLDLEQVVQPLEDPHLHQVVTSGQSLQQLQTLLEHRLQAAVLLLFLRRTVTDREYRDSGHTDTENVPLGLCQCCCQDLVFRSRDQDRDLGLQVSRPRPRSG